MRFACAGSTPYLVELSTIDHLSAKCWLRGRLQTPLQGFEAVFVYCQCVKVDVQCMKVEVKAEG